MNNDLALAIAEMGLTKNSPNLIVNNFMQKVIDGDIDPLELHLKAKFLGAIADAIKKSPDIIDAALNAADEYKDQAFRFGLTPKTLQRDIWDFTGDETHESLKREIKEREATMKTIKEPLVNPDTGETINPAVKAQGVRFIKWEMLK